MQLQNYISDLLYRYNCVTLPNFGAFLTETVSAKVHQTTHTMYPPKKMLSFNQHLKHNDGLLVNYIAKAEGISYDNALTYVNTQTKAIKASLLQGDSVTLKNIGDLSLNKDNRIVFNPSQHVNYLTNAFGLSHFSSNQVQREQVVEPQVVAMPNTAKQQPAAAIQTPVTHKPWVKYAAAAVLLGATAFGIYQNQNTKAVNLHNNNVTEQAQQQLQNRIQQATFVIPNPLPNITLNVTENVGQFHIVAGAFRVKENSIKRVNQLKKQGFNARLVGKNKYGLHQVAYGSYTTRSKAQQALQHIKNAHNPEAWLLVKALN